MELGGLVRKRIERLQHQDLEHEHRIKRRPPALGPRTAPKRCDQRPAENLEIHHRSQPLKRIARVVPLGMV